MVLLVLAVLVYAGAVFALYRQAIAGVPLF
jgi:hypothetical protein